MVAVSVFYYVSCPSLVQGYPWCARQGDGASDPTCYGLRDGVDVELRAVLRVHLRFDHLPSCLLPLLLSSPLLSCAGSLRTGIICLGSGCVVAPIPPVSSWIFHAASYLIRLPYGSLVAVYGFGWLWEGTSGCGSFSSYVPSDSVGAVDRSSGGTGYSIAWA